MPGNTGRLLGIARHGRPRGPMQTIDAADIAVATGVHGDFRGAFKPGGRNRRQVTVMAIEGWRDALAGLDASIAWELRRANLLTEGLALEGTKGARMLLGDAVLEITGECEPCSRMEEVAPGLNAALLPYWRGGVTTRVIEEGRLVVGMQVRIER